MNNYQSVLDQVRHYVTSYYKQNDKADFTYHNLKHTEAVVKAATNISNHYQLDDKNFFVVLCAAWFHDIGYYASTSNHEQKGADMAVAFLKEHGMDEAIDIEVKSCILSTRIPQHPSNLNEQIICDADLFHFGTDDFKENNKRMRKEYEALHHIPVDKSEWRRSTIKLLEQHQFHTDFCRLLLSDKKEENLRELRKKATPESDKPKERTFDTELPATVPLAEPLGKKNKDKPERGIETMFRISSSNHQRLSDMADNKAHILITVNSIILSAIISLLLRRLEDNMYLALPTFLLLTASLLTMIYAILATRPSIPEGTFVQKDIEEKKVNLLFFGNFYKMSLDDYAAGMWKTMDDKEFLYGSLIRDVYSQGVVLGRKYRLLRIAYNIFMYGLIISVLAFIIASAIHGKD
ncbi:putative metal-dependent HD superfamily phosphohydrolase [Arcticibacter tournemirensis]|uniref:HD domain-containing protein n=1 Tax=Arcticibacter tournemirensis TaxID=699437 RepID=A0A5M9HBG2_9SPHI|nr:Pycsar system effector family protein [Arcticibacter tournemirensis]KAA8482594.1 HD domain-containing protein [Arcticibacter tournemirensis]TQM52566.1 putative metal-dependent HD superfamily phosphohydrolase [Arcticibacter tournemirensis]